MDVSDSGYDHSKRRRLNDDPGSSRRGPVDLPASVPSLPPKPITASYPSDPSTADQSRALNYVILFLILNLRTVISQSADGPLFLLNRIHGRPSTIKSCLCLPIGRT